MLTCWHEFTSSFGNKSVGSGSNTFDLYLGGFHFVLLGHQQLWQRSFPECPQENGAVVLKLGHVCTSTSFHLVVRYVCATESCVGWTIDSSVQYTVSAVCEEGKGCKLVKLSKVMLPEWSLDRPSDVWYSEQGGKAISMCKWSDAASRENAGKDFAVRCFNIGGKVRDDAGDEQSLCAICRYTIYCVDG